MNGKMILGVSALMLLVGCASMERSDSGELEQYIAFCREMAVTPDEDLSPNWMVFPSTATTQEYRKMFKVIYADEQYLSYHAEEFSYTGGAHGTTRISVGTIDRSTGRRLRVTDCVPQEKFPALQQALYEGAVKKLGGKEHLQADVQVIDNFYLSSNGLHFIYNTYEIACYAKGMVEVIIDPKKL